MEEHVTVSVIIPVFDVADCLDDCLMSVAGQTYDDLEIIVIDDGSDDGSGLICDQWAQRDKRIAVIHQSNRGLSAARNAGLDRASGDYVVFVDSDDTVSGVYVETLLRAAISMGTQCVICGYASLDQNDCVRNFRPSSEPEVVAAGECFRRFLEPAYKRDASVSPAVWRKIYRRSLFEDACIRFPEGEVYEDASVLFPILHASGQIGLIPDILYFKSVRSGSITQINSIGNVRDWERAYGRLAEDIARDYPELIREVNRYSERNRILGWLFWYKLWKETKVDEAFEGLCRARAGSIEHRRDLAMPGDAYALLALFLLRYVPGFVPFAFKAWLRLGSRKPLRNRHAA